MCKFTVLFQLQLKNKCIPKKVLPPFVILVIFGHFYGPASRPNFTTQAIYKNNKLLGLMEKALHWLN